jgi:hypothetical protein
VGDVLRYLHVKNLDKYHPGYRDRQLIWCKIYFSMLCADPEFEMIPEIDKWRFIAFVILELQTRKFIPLNEQYLSRKGFDFKNRPLDRSLQMLQTFVELVTEDEKVCGVEKRREEKRREEVCRNFRRDSHQVLISEFLYENIKKIISHARPPNIRTWSKEVDLMLRLDKRDPQDIRSTIQWLFNSCDKDAQFWSTNILSPKKLRKHYDRLVALRNKAQPKRNYDMSGTIFDEEGK